MQIDSVEIVRALYDAFSARDAVKVLSLLSPDIELVQSTELAWGGRYQGHVGAREFFGRLAAHISSVVEIERFINSADHVTVIGWTRGTVNATGAAFDVPVAHVWELREGLAIRVRFFVDHPTMLKALSTRI